MTPSEDYWQQMRDEQRAAQYAQEHRPCRQDCTCPRHYQPGDAR